MNQTNTCNWIEANGVALRYALSGRDKTHGGADVDTVVLIHELGGSIESWDECLPAFEEKFRVLRYDQRGFGLSEKTTQLTLESCAADLLGLLDALGIDAPCHLVGTAMGAGIAIDFAIRHPERVARLVISSPATGGVPAAMVQAMEARIAAVSTDGMRVTVDTSLVKSYPEILRGDTARFSRYRLRWMGNDPLAFIAITRLAVHMNLEPELGRIQCPTLVIGCTHDPIRPATQSAALAQKIPQATFVEAASAHFIAVQTPQLFAELVVPFLAVAKLTAKSPRNE